VKIQRDVGPHFKLTEATKVCSLHFHPNDVKKGIGGKKNGFMLKEFVPRGFLAELRQEALGVSLNIPSFLGHCHQMPQEDEVKTQVIAVLRIHAERAINKIKNFYIWDQVTPLSLFPILNQLWTQFVVF